MLNQPKHSTMKWIKIWYIYTIEYYSVIKRNEVESVVVRWMNLKPIVHSEDRKNKYHINTYIWNLEKMVLMNLFAGQE